MTRAGQEGAVHARTDTLVDVLTVEEMLLYTAELKRPLHERTASKKQAVAALIEDLNLSGCRATRIGNSLHWPGGHHVPDNPSSWHQHGKLSSLWN